MNIIIDPDKLSSYGISAELANKINAAITALPAEAAWSKISKSLLNPSQPFDLHQFIFNLLFPNWLEHPESAAVWIPDAQTIAKSNLSQLMSELNLTTREEFHQWSVTHFETFWQMMTEKLAIRCNLPYTRICDLSQGVETPQWLTGAELNIAASCFNALPEKTALIYQNEKNDTLTTMSYGELSQLSHRIANSITAMGLKPGDTIAIAMPMTIEAVAIYLGIIIMGGIVVSIADSFSTNEIASRLAIANTEAIFTQDYIFRNHKPLPLYQKIIEANAPRAIVLQKEPTPLSLRNHDIDWQTFLGKDTTVIYHFDKPMNANNILFSSGTTGLPKAIPWNHTTAIKAASDAYLHQNIQPDDILCWPTNLGWMMGPWLIFAALINQASIAIYDGMPTTRAFGEFVQNARVTMLGVVPTLVAHYKQTQCMQGLDWQSIKVLSSTGECSNPIDMFYLMYLAGYKPIIEYCGGTEIGGSYITSTIIEKNYPSLFTTPAMGLDLLLLNESGNPTNNGEVALIPPSIGLSTELINADHHQIYYANMPKSPQGKILRRHGDQLRRYNNGLYATLGRADDTMNLGGIKISSAEIERVLVGLDNITETAAIAFSSNQGPSLLVIYAATSENLDKAKMKQLMQVKINQSLNPLFKIHDVVLVRELPKTASNKIMRRMLRDQYHI